MQRSELSQASSSAPTATSTLLPASGPQAQAFCMSHTRTFGRSTSPPSASESPVWSAAAAAASSASAAATACAAALLLMLDHRRSRCRAARRDTSAARSFSRAATAQGVKPVRCAGQPLDSVLIQQLHLTSSLCLANLW